MQGFSHRPGPLTSNGKRVRNPTKGLEDAGLSRRKAASAAPYQTLVPVTGGAAYRDRVRFGKEYGFEGDHRR